MENKEKSLPILSSEDGFTAYLKKVNSIPSLTLEEEFLLAKNYYASQDVEAAHKLVTSHLKLVVKIALTYRNYGLPITELVSEGNFGLMKAVKKYNHELGFRLSTYAIWWIKASIQEYVLKSWSLVKIGTTSAQKKLFFSLSKLKNKIRNLNSRDVNEGDYKLIAEELGVSESEVSEMDSRLSQGDLSLNALAYSDSDKRELIEFIPETRPSHEKLLEDKQQTNLKKAFLSKALTILNERELNIFQKRKLKPVPSTLKELSEVHKISEERVRQIENRAFEKIQSYVVKAMSDSQVVSNSFL